MSTLKLPETGSHLKSRFSPNPSIITSPKGSLFLNNPNLMSLRRHNLFDSGVQGLINNKKVKSSIISLEKRLRNSGSERKEDKKELDLAIYSQDQLLEIAGEILNRPDGSRSSLEIKLLMKCTGNVKFFMDIGISTHEQCCKYMTYEKLAGEETLFEIGSYGTKFYIILKGSVEILANLFSIFEETSPGGNIIQTKEARLTRVKVSKAGDSFGELALLENKPRAATIRTLEETHFIVLEKEYYDQILKEREMRKFYDEVNFYQSMELFNSWAAITLKYLVYHTEKKNYIRGQKVYQQKELAYGFYIIKEGEFQMLCKVKIGDNEYNKNFKPIEKTRTIDLSILTKGSFFGEEELIEESLRTSSVHCESQTGELVFISKREFHRRLLSEDKIREYLLHHIEIKKKWKLSKLRTVKNLEKPEFLANSSSNINSQPYLDKSLIMEKSQPFFKRNASILIENSRKPQKTLSSVLKLDFSKVFINKASHQIEKTSNSNNNLNFQGFSQKKHESIMISSLNYMENIRKPSNFDKPIEGYHPIIGRTISVFERNLQFSNSYNTRENLNNLEKVDEAILDVSNKNLEISHKNLEISNKSNDISNKNMDICNKKIDFSNKNMDPYQNIDKIEEICENATGIYLPKVSRKLFTNRASSFQNLSKTKLFHDSFSFSELLPSINNTQNANKSHISSKSNILDEIKASFKPREVMKLKAYRKFEELKENFNYFHEFKGKKKLEILGKFEVPNKLKIMIRDLHNKNLNNIKTFNKYIDTSVNFNSQSKEKDRKKGENEGKNQTKSRIFGEHIKANKTESEVEKRKKLPLKYMASEIQANIMQNSMFFPKIQGKNKKAKNLTFNNEKEIFIEGKCRIST